MRNVRPWRTPGRGQRWRWGAETGRERPGEEGRGAQGGGEGEGPGEQPHQGRPLQDHKERGEREAGAAEAAGPGVPR